MQKTSEIVWISEVFLLYQSVRSSLNGKTFIDDKELTQRLSLQRRTFQNFRNDNILHYYKIGGEVIYNEAEIEDWLNSNYHPRY